MFARGRLSAVQAVLSRCCSNSGSTSAAAVAASATSSITAVRCVAARQLHHIVVVDGAGVATPAHNQRMQAAQHGSRSSRSSRGSSRGCQQVHKRWMGLAGDGTEEDPADLAGRQEHERWIRKLRDRKSTKLTKRQRVANEQAARRAEEEARLAAVDWDPRAVGDQRVLPLCVCVCMCVSYV